MMFWVTLAAYEAVWFCAVIAAGHGLAWPGALAGLLFVAWRLWLPSERFAVQWRLLGTSLLIGAVLECLWVGAGWVRYAATDAWSPVPAWLLALWACFGLTIEPLFGYLRRRLVLAAVLGAIGGPMSYLAAARGWHAVTLQPPTWHGVVAIGAGWGIALPLLVVLAQHWSSAVPQRHGYRSVP